MTEEQLKKVKVGDLVRWLHKGNLHMGEVLEIELRQYCKLRVRRISGSSNGHRTLWRHHGELSVVPREKTSE